MTEELFESEPTEEINPMKMERVEVFINKNGFVSIKQESEYNDEFTQIVVIHRDQIPLLCKWLTELSEIEDEKS